MPSLPRVRYDGFVFRALHPRWHLQPLSGEGARLNGGRFNPVGRAALYTSCAVQTAMREAQQDNRPIQPVTLVSYRAEVGDVFDATDLSVLAVAGVDEAEVADDDWRARMMSGQPVPTHRLADRLIADGFRALLAPSFAPGALPGARNLVLWDWDGVLTVQDDEGRLNP